MLLRLPQGAVGGDFNSIIVISDSKKNAQQKMSPSCRNLVNSFSWVDSYHRLHPNVNQFSRYQPNNADGATRIDRSYQWGEITALESQYHSISFSDHLSLRVKYSLRHKLDRHLAPTSKPSYKIPPSVVQDATFEIRLESSMHEWLRVKDAGADLKFKNGVKFIAKQRGIELNKERMGILNMLRLKQVYYTSQVQGNVPNSLTELLTINCRISKWYQDESEKIKILSKCEDLGLNEKVRIFHHSQHQQF